MSDASRAAISISWQALAVVSAIVLLLASSQLSADETLGERRLFFTAVQRAQLDEPTVPETSIVDLPSHTHRKKHKVQQPLKSISDAVEYPIPIVNAAFHGQSGLQLVINNHPCDPVPISGSWPAIVKCRHLQQSGYIIQLLSAKLVHLRNRFGQVTVSQLN